MARGIPCVHERCTGGKEPDVKHGEEGVKERGLPAGIVIRGMEATTVKPLITAFIWGGKVRPVPTLPFGRWKPTAA